MSSVDRLRETLDRRIVVLDGAMGTSVQGLGLTDEAAWRGERFRDHPMPVKGCIDVLVLTRPEAIEQIHLDFLRAGADIVETDTFTATAVALADFGRRVPKQHPSLAIQTVDGQRRSLNQSLERFIGIVELLPRLLLKACRIPIAGRGLDPR